MPRKPDSFDAIAEFIRANPEAAMNTAVTLHRLYGVKAKATADDKVVLTPDDALKLVKEIWREPFGFFLSTALRGAAEQALTPKRKRGRPRKAEPWVHPDAVLRRSLWRNRVDAVAYALKADRLGKWKNDEALELAASAFPARRREVALDAMKRCRGERKRRDLKRRAAEVVLEVFAYSATPEEGKRLLRALQRGAAHREEKLIEPHVLIDPEGPSEALLSSLAAATPKPGRSKKSPS